MKRCVTFFISVIGLWFLHGCSLDSSNYVKDTVLDSEVQSISECLVHILENGSSIDYKADAEVLYKYNEQTKELELQHKNAAFNCCPEAVYSNAVLHGSSMVIVESEKAQMCNCSCLMNLIIVVKNVEKRTYIVKIVEPYLGTQDPISFVIDLSKAVSGSVTFDRYLDPWR